MILGNRIRTRAEALACGMPTYKYIANRMLTLVENLVLGLNLSECHTGYRAYRREVLERILAVSTLPEGLRSHFETQLARVDA